VVFISDEGLVAGSVDRAELVAAYESATDRAVRENLAAVGAEHGMYVEGNELIDPTADPSAPEPAAEVEPEAEAGPPAQADNKATWIDWAVSQGADPDEAEALTKAELVEFYGDKG
jgi:hypothetical protein